MHEAAIRYGDIALSKRRPVEALARSSQGQAFFIGQLDEAKALGRQACPRLDRGSKVQ